MAVSIVMEFPGASQAQYDAVMRELGLLLGDQGGDWPKGILSHMAGSTDDGWCVVDVWESQTAFGEFQANRLGPAIAKVGGLPEPRVTWVNLYNQHREG